MKNETNRYRLFPVENLQSTWGPCGSNTTALAMHDRLLPPSQTWARRQKRETLKTTKYVELVIVADNRERQGKDLEKVKQRLIEIANHVDKLGQEQMKLQGFSGRALNALRSHLDPIGILFCRRWRARPLNIRIVLVGVEVWNDIDKCSISQDPFTSLHEFLDWRKMKLLPRKSHDNAQLISGVYFQGTTIGMAPIMSMCTAEQSGGIVMDHSDSPLGAAVTLAHELGHNFGMNHDTLERGCSCRTAADKGGCIMNPSTGQVLMLPAALRVGMQLEICIGKQLGKELPGFLARAPMEASRKKFRGPTFGTETTDIANVIYCIFHIIYNGVMITHKNRNNTIKRKTKAKCKRIRTEKPQNLIPEEPHAETAASSCDEAEKPPFREVLDRALRVAGRTVGSTVTCPRLQGARDSWTTALFFLNADAGSGPTINDVCNETQSKVVDLETIQRFPFPMVFSSCSRKDLEASLEKGMGMCLFNLPEVTQSFGGRKCGNGYVEEGEECDCGEPEALEISIMPLFHIGLRIPWTMKASSVTTSSLKECLNLCCNATTCTLKPDAVCAHGLCCENCQVSPAGPEVTRAVSWFNSDAGQAIGQGDFPALAAVETVILITQLKPAGTACRDSSNSCDLPEFCTGASPHCPANVYLHDGHPCQGVDGYCYNGICQTHEQQCITLWGPGAKPAPGICFERVNSAGDPYGNCGKDSKSSFAKCEMRDAKCGKIQCQGGASRPVIGTNAVSIETNIPLQEGGRILCRGTHVYLGDDMPDPGLVLAGTKCADGKICLNRRCQNVSVFGVHECAVQCHGRGVCNNRKNCHCEAHWAPPFCDKFGFGGSKDSGPTRQADNQGLTIGILVTILCLLAAGFVLYLKRKTLIRLLFTDKKTTIEKLRCVRPSRPSSGSQPSQAHLTHLSKGPMRKPPPSSTPKDNPRRLPQCQHVDISRPLKALDAPLPSSPQRGLPPLHPAPRVPCVPARPLPANPALRQAQLRSTYNFCLFCCLLTILSTLILNLPWIYTGGRAVNAYRSDAFKSSFKQAPKKAFILFYETEEILTIYTFWKESATINTTIVVGLTSEGERGGKENRASSRSGYRRIPEGFERLSDDDIVCKVNRLDFREGRGPEEHWAEPATLGEITSDTKFYVSLFCPYIPKPQRRGLTITASCRIMSREGCAKRLEIETQLSAVSLKCAMTLLGVGLRTHLLPQPRVTRPPVLPHFRRHKTELFISRCAQMVGLICCSFSPDTHHLLTLYSYPWQARWFQKEGTRDIFQLGPGMGQMAGLDVIGKAQVQVLQRQLEEQGLKGSVEAPPFSARSRHMQLVLLPKYFMGSMPDP
ncbi:hypothetical protein E2I00_019312 [Balaenoptera physalus]|uniref:Disintegrin and metalloproteinase domain-containing protein 12 n=1 Tax=Balaenoptera physalus TaxID=9770 RepID=A0A6A1QHD6_BALPH|nr:hypothetical protein E2I00_019312 [Balaenoptera physalus]